MDIKKKLTAESKALLLLILAKGEVSNDQIDKLRDLVGLDKIKIVFK